MLYHLFHPLQNVVSGFRLFDYITFRAAWAAVLAFLVATVVGPGVVASLKRRKVAGYVATGSGAVDAERERKADVPTMGGVILLVGVGLSGFLFARLDTPYTWIALLAFLAFGALGAADDAQKLRNPASRGMAERHKLIGQVTIAFVAITALYVLGNAEDATPWLRGPAMKPNPYARWVKGHVVEPGESWASIAEQRFGDASRAAQIARYNGRVGSTGDVPEPVAGREIRLPPPWPDPTDHHRADLQVPFVKSFCLDLGLLFIPIGILVIVGASNAVNLTDGLDGLAIGITASVATAFAVIAYIVGRVDFSRELHLFYVPEAGELAVIGAALAGGSLGFLWFNGHPAQVFMGDTGALSIGGILGVLAVSLRHELTLAIAGGMFVAEVLSVVAQRVWFKHTRRVARRRGDENPQGQRLFLCAPLHHHYQFKGLHENKVTVRFWIVSMICVLVALASLKMR
jgi:phospho-N-acetylmuramoyl-pentapeptide-transferase